jgi:hypothetical protein
VPPGRATEVVVQPGGAATSRGTIQSRRTSLSPRGGQRNVVVGIQRNVWAAKAPPVERKPQPTVPAENERSFQGAPEAAAPAAPLRGRHGKSASRPRAGRGAAGYTGSQGAGAWLSPDVDFSLHHVSSTKCSHRIVQVPARFIPTGTRRGAPPHQAALDRATASSRTASTARFTSRRAASAVTPSSSPTSR